MKRLFLTGLVLNTLVSVALWAIGPGLALGYAVGSFAMLVNLLFLAAGRFWAGVGFLGLVALCYWVSGWLPGWPLYLFALGLASPALVSVIDIHQISMLFDDYG